jgi:hypothetical protein
MSSGTTLAYQVAVRAVSKMTLLAELRSWREQANWPWQRIA